MDLSIPYTTECLTFLTPESLTDNSWKTLILPFSSGMWAGVLFFLFCVGFVFYVLTQIHFKYKLVLTDTKNRKKSQVIMYNNKQNQMVSIKTQIISKKVKTNF